MKYIAQKTEDGKIKGKIAFYCQVLKVRRQGFYRDRPWKYQALAEAIQEICADDVCNDTSPQRADWLITNPLFVR